MKCLWLTRKYPRPVNSGELIYSDGLIRSLARTGVRMTVISHDNDETPVAEGGTGEVFHDDQGVEWRLGSARLGGRLPSLFSKYPSDAWRLKNGGPEVALNRALAGEAWDVVVIDHAAIGWAADAITRHTAKCQRRPVIVYVSHNHEARIRREIARHSNDPFIKATALRYDAWKYARLENFLCRNSDLITAITASEVEAYRGQFPDREFLCLPPGYDGFRDAKRVISAETPRRVIMSGSFEWIAKRLNLELFLERAARPFAAAGIELQIVGKTEESFREAISARYPSVRFVGRVPEMTPYLRGARVGLIVEEHGGGFKLKSLDYIFHGLPLAGLHKAVDGLPLHSPDHILLADDTDRLVREVIGMIDDFDRLNRMRTEAFRICEGAFRWEDRGERFREKVESLISPGLAR